jgi:HEAT repeat protein
MTEIRQELLNLIALNNAEQWVPEDIAFQQQLDRHAVRLVPGLIECLGDDDAEVRRLAIALLSEGRPLSDVAVPAMIEMLTDPDRLVRTSAAFHLGFFGPLAHAAIPLLEPWLTDADEYVRALALTTILRADPTRSEFLPLLRAAAVSVNVGVSGLAQDYLDERSAWTEQ